MRMRTRHTGELPHEDLLCGVKNILQPDGALCVVLPLPEGVAFIACAVAHQLFCIRQTTVYSKVDKPPKRLLLHFSATPAPVQKDTVIIHRADGSFTSEYKMLTGAFYLKF
jgi:tRNA1Val (adenine37-N6)-methyltransferase